MIEEDLESRQKFILELIEQCKEVEKYLEEMYAEKEGCKSNERKVE